MLTSSSVIIYTSKSLARERYEKNASVFFLKFRQGIAGLFSLIIHFFDRHYSFTGNLPQDVLTALLKEVSEGSHSAFEKLYKHYFRKCFSIALYFVHLPYLAEDIVSEVFLALWNKRGSLKDIRDWEAFLFISTRNRAVSFAGKHGKIKHDPLEMLTISIQSPDLSPEEAALKSEFDSILQNALERLPDKSRMVYYMVREEKMSYREISKILDISERTVNTHMTIAVKRLVVSLTESFTITPSKKPLKKPR